MGQEIARSELGQFSSIVCFKAVVEGVEHALGVTAANVALKAAGRKRGHALVASLGLTGQGTDLPNAGEQMAAALGADGTRLCIIEGIEEEDDRIRVLLRETICMAGEPRGTARRCSFTFGAVHGALEALTGRKLRGKHTRTPLEDDVATEVFEFWAG